MKLYSIPRRIKTFIFDIDGTLYTNAAYVKEQVDVQIRYWASINGMTSDEGRRRIADFRAAWRASHGRGISLGNTFFKLGVSVDDNIKWRNDLLRPELYLKPEPEFAAFLKDLGARYNLICVTNNPVAAGRRTLVAAGISDALPKIIGLDTCRESKPSRAMLLAAMRETGSAPGECVSVGDRYDIDLALPIEMGMGGVLVSGEKDVMAMPRAIEEARKAGS